MEYNLFLGVILLVAVILILIVMVQNPKGGGLSSSFGGGGAQSLGGVQNTNNFLDKTTWTLAIAMFSLILLSNFAINRGSDNKIQLNNTLEGIETTIPTAPAVNTNDSLK
jgi:preprotein translocase subunit SecG